MFSSLGKSDWHQYVMLVWLCILLILIIAGTAVPHVRTDFGGGCRSEVGLFRSCTKCGGVSTCQNIADVTTNCAAPLDHIKAASAFAILSIFVTAGAIVVSFFSPWLPSIITGIVVAVDLFFMMLVWAIVAGYRNGKFCNSNFSAADGGAKYTHGFLLFLIPWVFTVIIFAVWMLKVLKILPEQQEEEIKK